MNSNEFMCDITNCGKRFTRRSTFEAHKNRHLNLRSYPCDYEGCGAAYFLPQHLKRHVGKIHLHPRKEFKCSEVGCLANFDTEFALLQHSNKVHPIKKDLISCCFCELKFEKDWQVKEHEASHTKTNPFRCEICDQEFDAYTNFKIHRKEHKKSRPSRVYQCDQCSQSFENYAEFRKHKHQEWTCKQCNKVFNNKSNFNSHSAVHLENRVEFKCSFPNCSRVYYHKKNLTKHVRTSHDGNLYACHKCGNKLSTKQKLKYHLAQHEEAPTRKTPQKGEDTLINRLAGQLAGRSSTNILELPNKKPKVKKRARHVSQILAAKQQFPSVLQTEETAMDKSQNVKINQSVDDERELQSNEY